MTNRAKSAAKERSRAESIRMLAVLALAILVALLSARDYPGGWNDLSRLAAIESLVDFHTLAIDQSTLLAPDVREEGSFPAKTKDLLRVGGSYYSDKPMVPQVLLAVGYWVLQQATGLSARLEPGAFCRAMTLLSSGLGYVVAVTGMYSIGAAVGLSPAVRILLAGSLGLGTLALPYAAFTNSHEMFLGAAVALFWVLDHIDRRAADGFSVNGWTGLAGLLVGLGYSLDQGAGPPLLLAVTVYVAAQGRCAGRVGWFLVGIAPAVLLHHVINYQIGGTWRPANAVAEYTVFPGSAATLANMTGGWKHASPFGMARYAILLLFGKEGFVGHNPTIYLFGIGSIFLIRRRFAERPLCLLAIAWCLGVWFVYAAGSNNYAGQCLSIRWFVPILAPAYYVLAILLREYPDTEREFIILSMVGAGLAISAAPFGPWVPKPIPLAAYWSVQLVAALACLWIHRRRARGGGLSPAQAMEPCPRTTARAA